jgi:hypothetical protein
MQWAVLYLCSVIGLLIIAGLIASHEDKIVFENRRDVFVVAGLFIGWPLVLLWVPFYLVYDFLKNRLEAEAKVLLTEYELTNNKHDRSSIVIVPEAHLRTIMKAFRRDLIKLTPNQVEIIREELQHRVVERSLLK